MEPVAVAAGGCASLEGVAPGRRSGKAARELCSHARLRSILMSRSATAPQAGLLPGFSISAIWSRMINFCGLPVIVIGSASTTRMCRGTL